MQEMISIGLSIIPKILQAQSQGPSIPLSIALFMEAFITIHMTIFVIRPFSEIFTCDSEKQKSLFWKIFLARILILGIADIIGFLEICFIDFIMVFVGAFILVPISGLIKNKKANKDIETYTNSDVYKQLGYFCKNCGNKLNETDRFCAACGQPSHLWAQH